MPAVTVFKAWRGRLLASLLGIYLLSLILVSTPIPIPGRDMSEVIWPVLSLVVVGGCVMTRKVLHEVHFETVHPQRSWRRGCLYVCVLMGVTGIAALASIVGEVDTLVAVRNAMFFLGIVGLCGPLRSTGAMLGLAVLSCATWILGSGVMGSEPAWWAIFLHAPDESTTLLICAGVFLMGTLTDCVLRRG